MTGLLLVLMFVLTIFMIVQFVLTERITGQENELNALGSEIAALAQALGLEERTSEGLRNQLGELDATLRGAEAQIAALTATRDRQAVALQAAQSRITDFETQVAALLGQRDQALADVAGLQDRQAELLDEQSALNLALAAARSEVDAQAEAARLAAARREALTALVEDLQARNAEFEDRNRSLANALDETAQALSDEEAARLAEAAAAEALRARLKDANAELTAMTLALEAKRQEAEDTLTLLAAARSANADLDTELATALLRLENTQADLQTAQDAEARAQSLEQGRAALAQTLADIKASAQAQSKDLRERLALALAEKLAAQNAENDQTTAAERRATLLAQARQELTEQQQISAKAQRQTELLNQQVAALRAQLGDLQALLDDAKDRDRAAKVQLESLGSELNTALARVAAAERRKAVLEEAERKRLEQEAIARRAEQEAERARLEQEAEALKAQAKDLEQYRSEFFGRLRAVLGNQEGVRIEGDRFVFSSEVLFAPGAANLSFEGQGEIAKVANILRSIAGSIPSEIDWIIRVDGHTDNQPLSGQGEFRDNWELSQARALSVVRYMVGFLDIPPDRLSANGFGQYHPIAQGNTEAARAQNRRIELKFTEK
jgi:chemotaxis protein MotB